MPHPRSKTSASRGPSAGLVLLSLLMMVAEWVLLVGGTKLQEMVVGVAAVLVSAVFLAAVRRCDELRVDFRFRDLVQGWRVPWYILSGVWELSVVLLRDLLGIERPGSFFRVSGFKTAKEQPELVARRVLATAYTTAGPSTIVIGIDYEQSRMLFHQIKRNSVPLMTKALGAQP